MPLSHMYHVCFSWGAWPWIWLSFKYLLSLTKKRIINICCLIGLDIEFVNLCAKLSCHLCQLAWLDKIWLNYWIPNMCWGFELDWLRVVAFEAGRWCQRSIQWQQLVARCSACARACACQLRGPVSRPQTSVSKWTWRGTHRRKNKVGHFQMRKNETKKNLVISVKSAEKKSERS